MRSAGVRLRRVAEGQEAGGVGAGALCSAAVLVGLAIVLDGAAASMVNGLGGLLWLGAGALLVRAVRRSERPIVGSVAVLGATLTLVLVARPFAVEQAARGFAAAGLVVTILVRPSGTTWAFLVPAAWLPVHLVVAIGRSLIEGGTRIRTDPPPTAAIVPLIMVLAAWAGGWLAQRAAAAWPNTRETMLRGRTGD